MDIQYNMKSQTEKIGSITLNIECLDNLDHTIDEVFKHLEKAGNPQDLEELCPYFGVIWPAARALSEHLCELPKEDIYNKRVLELGCGLALPSMVCSRLGAHVLATDFHPEVPRFLTKNIELNQIHNLEYLRINWETENPPMGEFDRVIGSDILYERRYPDPLAKTIRQLLVPGGEVIITDPGRPYLQGFVDAMQRQGFQQTTTIKEVPHPPQRQEIFVLSFRAH
jgi:predicted nicotinamide N-methyase